MSESLEVMIRKDIEAGGPWSKPNPVKVTSDAAIEALGMAMGLSAMQIKLGMAGTAIDRARLVAGELELLNFYIAPRPKP